jgi:hypothetical protein
VATALVPRLYSHVYVFNDTLCNVRGITRYDNSDSYGRIRPWLIITKYKHFPEETEDNHGRHVSIANLQTEIRTHALKFGMKLDGSSIRCGH